MDIEHTMLGFKEKYLNITLKKMLKILVFITCFEIYFLDKLCKTIWILSYYICTMYKAKINFSRSYIVKVGHAINSKGITKKLS